MIGKNYYTYIFLLHLFFNQKIQYSVAELYFPVNFELKHVAPGTCMCGSNASGSTKWLKMWKN